MYDPEKYFEVFNQYCKPPQNVDFWKTELSFGFTWFEKFPYEFISHLMGGWNLMPVFCFIWSWKWKFWVYAKKSYQTWQRAAKILKKIKMLQQHPIITTRIYVLHKITIALKFDIHKFCFANSCKPEASHNVQWLGSGWVASNVTNMSSQIKST